MSKPPGRPNYDHKLARPITLADGTSIVTLIFDSCEGRVGRKLL